MKRLAVLIGLVLLVVPVLAAEDFTGKWSGAFVTTGQDGSTKDETILLDLRHKGTELTGTAGPSAEKQWPLSKGTVDGNKLSFEVQSDGPLVKFALTFADGHLKGDAAAEFEGQKMSAKVDAQRKVGF
jgi:hypothetical protein